MENSIDVAIQERECRIVYFGIPPEHRSFATTLTVTGARLIACGMSVDELRTQGCEEGNVLYLGKVEGHSSTIDAIIASMPNLEYIFICSAGLCHVPDSVFKESYTLTNLTGVHSPILAEYCMSAILYFNKNIIMLNEYKQQKKYVKRAGIVSEVRGKTLGIVGYGDIGKACAKLAKPFGMKVIGLRRRPEMSAEDEYIDMCYGLDKLYDLMAESDYLLITAPMTTETCGMISAEALAKSKEGQIIINLGRGGVIDEPALIEALKKGPIGGAALDVFTVEPLPEDSELWTLPNVLISPHCAFADEGVHLRIGQLFRQNCEKWIAGEPLLNVLDLKRSLRSGS